MKHFYEFIVLDEQEAKIECPITDYEYDDYRYWGLYDMDEQCLVFFGDNIHNNGIEDEIEAFCKGMRYVDINFSLETGYVVLSDISCVTATDVLEKLKNDEMYDEVL